MKLTKRQKMLLESANDWIQSNYPQVGLVGVAWWFLDCGCMAGMGFSLKPSIISRTVRIDRTLVADETVPECVKCSEHNLSNLDRKFTLGTAWFKPVLDSNIRDRIKREVFGPLLEREIVEMYQGGESQATH
jgi:hypothetical protein